MGDSRGDDHTGSCRQFGRDVSWDSSSRQERSLMEQLTETLGLSGFENGSQGRRILCKRRSYVRFG